VSLGIKRLLAVRRFQGRHRASQQRVGLCQGHDGCLLR
jgi:hypothetical protein